MEKDITTYRRALDDFHRARSKAAMQRFWAGIQGKSLDLLPYNEISTKLKAVSQTDRGLQLVPLEKIIGSVDRADDFNKNFLPLKDSDLERWALVKTLMTSPLTPGLPPVHLYKIGDAYFVLDGNHRVSIAKDMGMKDIEAYVTEFRTRVAVPSSITPEELVLKSAYVEFLEKTRLDAILPGIDFSLSDIRNYELLQEHISVHRYYMGIEQGREVPYEEAVVHWYDQVYLPVVYAIQASGLQEVFHSLTLTDLYLWVLDQQTRLQEELGGPIKTENVADFAAQVEGTAPKQAVPRGEKRIDEVLQKSEAEPQADFIAGLEDHLLRDLLVAISDKDTTWEALEQAIMINQPKVGNIRGLHILREDQQEDDEKMTAMRERFDARLRQAGMPGKLLFYRGEVARLLTMQSLLSDVLILKLTYPPTGSLFERLGSGMAELLRKVRRPVLIVRDKAQPFTSLLLLFDGTSKSKEALYLAAYYSALWNIRLTVFTLEAEPGLMDEAVTYAKTYLQKLNLPFDYILEQGTNLTEAVMAKIDTGDFSTLVAGGYKGTSLMNRVFSSSVDQLMDRVRIPALICQ